MGAHHLQGKNTYYVSIHASLLLVILLLSNMHSIANVAESRPLSHFLNNFNPRSLRGGDDGGRCLRSTLSYYVQVGLNNVDLGVLIPPINISYTNTFGRTQLFAFNVTETTDPLSTKLGYVRGYTVSTSYDNTTNLVEVEAIQMTNATCKGTIQIQALIIAGPNEIAIVGGTGDFRGARGYGFVNIINATASIVLYQHTLHFMK